jgi:two-component system sensor histidine kinase VicK
MIIGKLGNKILNAILILIATQFLITMFVTVSDLRNMEESTLTFINETMQISKNVSSSAMEGMGKEIIKTKAEDVTKELEVYIKSHPNMTVYDLQNDTEFNKIAVQPVGKTGYTAVTDYNTLICRFHKDPKIVNMDLSLLAEKLPGFWAIMSRTRGGITADGFYEWIDPDGTKRFKYMYIAIINATTADKVGMHVAATTYIDEFSLPTLKFSEELDEHKNIMLSNHEKILSGIMNDIILVFIFTLILVIILTVFITRSIIKPITEFRRDAKEISNGNLDVKIKVKSDDEIGELAEAFNQMTNDIRKSRAEIENYSKGLEKRVKERTAELDKKVDELTNSKTAMLNMMEDLDNANKELLTSQNRFKKSFNKLKELDVDKDRFISIAAHELKTPMTAISGFAQLLENEKIIENDEIRNKYLKIIETEIKRLGKLVTEVLDLSRIDLGTMKFTVEDVDTPKNMEEIKNEMLQRTKEKGLSMNFSIEQNLPIIKTDREKLREILINLIDNSIKYTKRGGIKVDVHKEYDHIKFSVADTGIGISKKYFSKLFTRFYQIESPFTRKAGGTGLGLSICKEFVENLGGRIWLKSKVGKGTTFYFTLPLKLKTK